LAPEDALINVAVYIIGGRANVKLAVDVRLDEPEGPGA